MFVHMGHDFSKPLSLKGFWALITIAHHYLLETLNFGEVIKIFEPFAPTPPASKFSWSGHGVHYFVIHFAGLCTPSGVAVPGFYPQTWQIQSPLANGRPHPSNPAIPPGHP